MYIKIRKINAQEGEEDTIITISKMAMIQELREMIQSKMNVKPENQMLLYKGKEVSK